MPSRISPLVTGQIYHIYNRGTEKRSTFESRRDQQRFLKTLLYYHLAGPKPKFSHFKRFPNTSLDPSKKIVDILAYCLMPNHFHLLLKQLKDEGVTEFLGKLTNSYTKYYNTKHNRVGPLFQGEFKSVLVDHDEQLIHVSRYIHLNPLSSFLVKNLDEYEWSSYLEYAHNKNGVCSKDAILSYFKSPKEYIQFILDQASYAQALQLIKHQLIDEEI